MTATETTSVVQIQKGPHRSENIFGFSEQNRNSSIRAIKYGWKLLQKLTWIFLDDVIEEGLSRSRNHAGHDTVLDVGGVHVEKLLVELHRPKVVLARLAGGQETFDLSQAVDFSLTYETIVTIRTQS